MATEGITGAALAARVRALLDARGISGVELAARMGWTQSYVARRLSGRVVWQPTEIAEIAHELGLDGAAELSELIANSREIERRLTAHATAILAESMGGPS